MSLDVLTISYLETDADEQFESSLRHSGFAVIKDHPVPNELINTVYDEWASFFISAKKNDYLFDEEKQDGYFPYLTENAKGSKAKDLKEFYHIYPWGRMPQTMSDASLSLFHALTDVASTLLGWVQANAPDEVQSLFSIPLKDMIQNSQSNLFRIIHYPPISWNESPTAIRAAAHEDINLLTVLLAGSQPGLQVMDMDGDWHDVSCDRNTIVVNSGDMLKMVSDGYYPSTTHQVINPDPTQNVSRYSMPLFLHPRDEVVLSKNHTAGSYLKERLEEIGLK